MLPKSSIKLKDSFFEFFITMQIKESKCASQLFRPMSEPEFENIFDVGRSVLNTHFVLQGKVIFEKTEV